MTTPRRHIHFVTGKLAAEALRNVVAALAQHGDFDYSIDVLPITVAALMTPQWIARHIQVPDGATEVLLPGYCEGDLCELEKMIGSSVVLGPRDLRELPAFFNATIASDYGEHTIEIIAEINHAPKFTVAEVVRQGKQLAADGADFIDVGCIPGIVCREIGDYVRALRDAGLRVSVDSFDQTEVAEAIRAGAELVLSVNGANAHLAVDWGAEVVVIPDDIATMGGLSSTIGRLDAAGVGYRIDPILEPIGCGFAASLQRYMDVRNQFPEAKMMMGIGNLSELTDVDSAGVNVLLLAICEELSIDSVLTTQVIPWAQSSVKECDLARRLVHYAVRQNTIPKHVEPQLVMLRDAHNVATSTSAIASLAQEIRDNNFRLFANDDGLHAVSRQLHLQHDDPFALFDQLMANRPETIDQGHAFYLGFELAKAYTALTLGKTYRQDEALDWGFLTREEQFHRLPRTNRHKQQGKGQET